jgi:hypothetical protein
MEVDRNAMFAAEMPVSTVRRAAQGLELGGYAHGRIELGANLVSDLTLPTTSHVKVTPRPRYGEMIVNGLVLAVALGGVGAALARFVHVAAGWSLVRVIPAAFDGGSLLWSAGLSLGALAFAVALAIMGNYARPRSLGYFLSAVGMLLVAVAMITVTFSVEPDGPPALMPVGSRLVPFAMPIVPVGIALRLLRNGWTRAKESYFNDRFFGALFAAASAAFAFAAVELLFGSGLLALL